MVEGTLQINCNDPANGTVEVALAGSGMPMLPEIEVEPAEIVFDTTLVNQTTTEILTISNTGIATLNVTDIISSNDVFTVNISTFDIEPNETQELEVTFAPDEQMLFEGFLQIESNDPNGTVEIDLSGYGDIDTYTNEISSNADINIYPNPVQDLLFLENVKGKELAVYDLMGSLLLSQVSNQKNTTINVSTLKNGTYVLKIQGKKKTIMKKIIVKK